MSSVQSNQKMAARLFEPLAALGERLARDAVAADTDGAHGAHRVEDLVEHGLRHESNRVFPYRSEGATSADRLAAGRNQIHSCLLESNPPKSGYSVHESTVPGIA